MHISKLLFVFLLLPMIACGQDSTNHVLDISVGGNYTNMKYLRTKQDQLSGNGVIYSSSGPVSNKSGLTFGLGFTYRTAGLFRCKTGLYISSASAFGDKNVYYDGLGGNDTFITDVLHYHYYLLEVPEQIGMTFSKKFPVTLIAGITFAVAAGNKSEWSYTFKHNIEEQDSLGNWYYRHVSEHKVSKLGATFLSVAFSSELFVPLVRLHQEYAGISIGITSYLLPVSSFTYTRAVTYDIMRLTHTSYYARITIPILPVKKSGIRKDAFKLNR
jgi:hypothetical protein